MPETSQNVFEEITIDNTLSEIEKTAIDKIKSIQPDALKTALTTETIAVKGSPENKKMTFMEIADAFIQYKIIFPTTKPIIDDYGNNNTQKTQGTFESDTPERLKTLILDPDQNDFAYFLSVVSNVFKGSTEQQKETTMFGEETMKQLTELKSKITVKSAVVVEVSAATTATTEVAKTEVAPTTPETTSEKIEINAEEINAAFTTYKISAEDIVAAINTLKLTKQELAKKIIPLLKVADVKAVQIELGMEEKGTNLTNRADGKFGRKSLANLENGEVVKYNPKQKVENGVEKTVVARTIEEEKPTTNDKVEQKKIKKTQERFTIGQIQEQLKDYNGEDKHAIVAAIQKQVTVNKNQISAFEFKDKFIVIAKNEIKVFFTKWDAIQFATPKINENFLKNKNTWEKAKVSLKKNALVKVNSMQVYKDSASKMRINEIPGIIFKSEEEVAGFKGKIRELIKAYGYTIPYFKNSYNSATSPFYQSKLSLTDVFIGIEKNKTEYINKAFANKITTPDIAKNMVKYLNSLQCWYNSTPKKEILAIS